MISAFREILNYTSNNHFEFEEESEEYPLMLGLRRFHEHKCKSCCTIFYHIASLEFRNNIICWICSSRLISKTLQYHKNLNIKRGIYSNVIPRLLQEIQEFGMRPNRVYQTQLFEYYIFKDLSQLI